MTTRVNLIRETVPELGDLVMDSLTTGVGAAYIDDTNLIMSKTDQIAGYYLYIFAGTGIAQERIISAFNTAAHRATVPTNFAVTPVVGDAYYISKRFRHSDYVRALNGVIDDLKWKAAVPKWDRTIRIGDILSGDAEMERWASGTSSAPDSSTLNGAGAAIARESTIVDKGSYSAKLTNQAATAAYLEYSITQYLKWASKSFTAKCRVWASSATRVRLALTDGVTTTYSSYHTGASGFEELSVEMTISASPTSLKLQLRIETGGSISVYFDNGRLTTTDIYNYEMPTGFITLHKITKVGSTEEVYTEVLDDRDWRISHSGSQAYLTLSSSISYDEDYALWLEGMKGATVTTADSDTLEFNDELIKAGIAMRLLASKFRPEDKDNLNIWANRYAMALRDLSSRLPSNSRLVGQQ